MKKNIFIVSAYPNTKRKIEVLKNCIDSLICDEFDILLCTNNIVTDKDILSKITYYIYDSQDIKDYYDYGFVLGGSGWWAKLFNFYLYIDFNNAYHYDIYRCIYDGLNLCISLGYEFFYYVEGDCELSDDNIKDLLSYKEKMMIDNKKLIFFKGLESHDGIISSTHFCSIIFGGYPNFFIDNIKLPYKIEDWIQDDFLLHHAFETFIYDRIKHVMDDILLLDNEELFKYKKLSQIRRSVEELFTNFLFYNKDENRFYLVLYNLSQYDVKYEIFIDNDLYLTRDFSKRWHFVAPIDDKLFFNKNIKSVIHIDNEIEYSTNIYMDIYNINKIKHLNKITTLA